MLEAICEALKNAKLSKATVSVEARPENQLSVVVTFLPSAADDYGQYHKENINHEQFVALKSALATPIVVTGNPECITGEMAQKIAEVQTSLAKGHEALSALDFNAKVEQATKSASTSKKSQATQAETGEPKEESSSVTPSNPSEMPEDVSNIDSL